MDTDGALANSKEPRADDVTKGFLARMAERYQMATTWRTYLERLQASLYKERKKYKSLGGIVGASPQSSASDGGGGLKEYVLHFEKSHKSFGMIRENDNDEWEMLGRQVDCKPLKRLFHEKSNLVFQACSKIKFFSPVQ